MQHPRPIALVRSFNTMLSKNGENEHACLFPNPWGKAFHHIFTTEYDVSSGFFIYSFYYVEVYSLNLVG